MLPQWYISKQKTKCSCCQTHVQRAFTESQKACLHPACFMPNLVPFNSFLRVRNSTLAGEGAAACHTQGRHMGQPFTSVVLGWVPMSPMSNSHYCLSISCRHVKKTLRRSHSQKCFSHFCSASFHLSSLTPCQGLIS